MNDIKIKDSVINTFNRYSIDYQYLLSKKGTVEVENRFGGGKCETSPLIAYLIEWIYQTSNDFEVGRYTVNLSDFDRIRYFVLEQDKQAYMTCID